MGSIAKLSNNGIILIGAQDGKITNGLMRCDAGEGLELPLTGRGTGLPTRNPVWVGGAVPARGAGLGLLSMLSQVRRNHYISDLLLATLQSSDIPYNCI